MAVDVRDVPVWVVQTGGIGHAVGRENSGAYYTACGSLMIGGRRLTRLPPRVCRKCRAKLAEPDTRLRPKGARGEAA